MSDFSTWAINSGVLLGRIQALREFTAEANALAMPALSWSASVTKSDLHAKEILDHLACAVRLMDEAKAMLERELDNGLEKHEKRASKVRVMEPNIQKE